MPTENINDYHNYNAANFDPNQMAQMTSTVIMFILVQDVSISVLSYKDQMNMGYTDIFMKEYKNCHRKNDIVIKAITFGETVKHRSGFAPVISLPDNYLDVNPNENKTALYEGVLEALLAAKSYREDLENQGIEVRTCIHITTDGDDNVDKYAPYRCDEVKRMIQELRQNEAWLGSYTITMMGIGTTGNFRQSCINMGLDPDKCLMLPGDDMKKMREQMGVVSRSASQSTAGTTVSF